MHITSHAACGPIIRIYDNGRLLVARMEYTRRGRTSVRHIMESGKNGETILETLKNGVLKEGAKDRNKFSMNVLSPKPIHIEFGPDQDNPGGTHLKPVFPVSVIGELRDFVAQDDDSVDETHGPITMVDIEDLILETEGRTIPFHYRVTRKLLLWVARQNSEVFHRYHDFVVNSSPSVGLDDKVRKAIKSYTGCGWQ